MPESVWAPVAPSSTTDTRPFAPVAPDELGFALSIFVAAANRTLMASQNTRAALSLERAVEGENLLGELLVHRTSGTQSKGVPHLTGLSSAFAALWSEYRDHDMRDSICARVLCFYFLTEKTRGKIIEPWASACPDRPEEIVLDPAVIEALAVVPFAAETGLLEGDLVAAIHQVHSVACLS